MRKGWSTPAVCNNRDKLLLLISDLCHGNGGKRLVSFTTARTSTGLLGGCCCNAVSVSVSAVMNILSGWHFDLASASPQCHPPNVSHTVHVLTIFQGIKCYYFVTQIISGMPRPRWPDFNAFEYSVIDSDFTIIKEIKNMKIMRARFLYNSFHYCERLAFFCSRRRLFICNIWFFPILLFN